MGCEVWEEERKVQVDSKVFLLSKKTEGWNCHVQKWGEWWQEQIWYGTFRLLFWTWQFKNSQTGIQVEYAFGYVTLEVMVGVGYNRTESLTSV